MSTGYHGLTSSSFTDKRSAISSLETDFYHGYYFIFFVWEALQLGMDC